MAKLSVDNGYRTANSGTAWSFYSFVADYFDFKEYYTREELNELVTWFDERMDRLPQQLVIDDTCTSSDLPKTVRALCKLAGRQHLDVCFSGYFSQLFTIRERLQAQGME